MTENEIDEFFKGRPELVNSSQALKADNLDLMPYDVKYEVELDDVEFGEFLNMLRLQSQSQF